MEKPNITGVHHISLKAEGAEAFERVLDFYCNILGLELHERWENASGLPCAMIRLGGGVLLEVMSSGTMPKGENGSVDHFALATDTVDLAVEAVREAGYEITMEPRDGRLGVAAPRDIRIAFCRGPLGESIEFFHVK